MKRFFISYASDDLAAATCIHNYLAARFRGKAEFFLSDLMEPSTPWMDRLHDEIERADAGLFLLTPRSVSKPWVNIEVGAFCRDKKKIFPLIGGGLSLSKIHRPLSDFQVAQLENSDSVARLIREISNMCGIVAPAGCNARQFREDLTRAMKANIALPSIGAVKRTLSLTKIPRAVSCLKCSRNVEPEHLTVLAGKNQMLHVKGTLKEAGIVTLSLPQNRAARFLIIEARRTETITSNEEGQTLKLVVNNEPILPFLASQRHWRDEQYIPNCNGFFVYCLDGVATQKTFRVKLVFWNVDIQGAMFRLYLA